MKVINLDWFEVFCHEPADSPRDAHYFMSLGYAVKVREYGTPVYQEMFTICAGGWEFLEVRRNPCSKKSTGGILEDNICHLRLSNRTCYQPNPIKMLREFLTRHHYKFDGVSRADICCDFCNFETGVSPVSFINRYMRGEIVKINQSKISAHGKDSFDGKIWNSLSWGSPRSMVSTKFYCKTLELKEAKDKPYIRQIWYEAGLTNAVDDNDTQIWRVEFSIRGEAKQWYTIIDETHEQAGEVALPNMLTTYDSREKLSTLFLSLSHYYFHFKKMVYLANGKKQRKDRCPDVRLFRLHDCHNVFKPERLTERKLPTRTDKMLIKLCEKISCDETLKDWQKDAACAMIDIIRDDLLGKERRNKQEDYLKRHFAYKLQEGTLYEDTPKIPD